MAFGQYGNMPQTSCVCVCVMLMCLRTQAHVPRSDLGHMGREHVRQTLIHACVSLKREKRHTVGRGCWERQEARGQHSDN